IFLENYDMRLARRLISGVDVWLNTPTRPLEASGTSGEKAEMNGVLNFSVLDGWWYEGYKEGAGWALTDKRTYDNQEYQDQLDASTIYYTLENKIIPLYFAQNSKGYSPEWVQYIKNSICQIAPDYTTKRMLDDYIQKFYRPLAERSAKLSINNFAKAKEIALWKENVAAHWDSFQVVSITWDHQLEKRGVQVGSPYKIEVVLDKKDLEGDLGIDLVITTYDNIKKEQRLKRTEEFKVVKQEGTLVYYEVETSPDKSGLYKLGLRVYPKNPDLPNRMDFAYTRWIG
ncbi:MAG: alpha-glucan family phosphorylase, partial [Tannerellaceae bacterium]